jgi:hypothetical protein
MLQQRLCHTGAAHCATGYDRVIYVINACVTPQKGVTPADPRPKRLTGRAAPSWPGHYPAIIAIAVGPISIRIDIQHPLTPKQKCENGANGASTFVDMNL